MSPSVREWLPAGHLAWYLLEVVERLDVDGFLWRVPGGRQWAAGA